MKTTKHPKRTQLRFRSGLPATLHYHGRDYPCLATSLSRSGVLLSGEIPWPSETEVTLTISNAEGELRFTLSGRVAHVYQDVEQQQTRVGVEFDRVPRDCREVMEALLSRVVEGTELAPLKLLRPGSPPREVIKALERIPLAHRVALAKRANPVERGFLRQDPKPQVLESLARNPNITPSEIKQLARMHQLLPSTLEFIAEDSRWVHDEELKLLVATHPRVTLQVAEQVIDTLGDQARRKVLLKPGLNPVLRAKLVSRDTERRRRGW